MGFGAAALVVSSSASADLKGDVDRLTLAWQLEAEVAVQEPRLLERGDRLPLLLPPAAVNPTTPDCATVAVLGAPTATFSVETLQPSRPSWRSSFPRNAVGGMLELRECGAAKAQLGGLAIEMRSPRAVVQTVVAMAEGPVAHVVEALLHRDPGPFAPLTSSGPRPRPAPLMTRLSSIEAWASERGALDTEHVALTSKSDGTGRTLLELSPGCHRLDALGSERDARDVDLEVQALPSRRLGEDISDNADASVVFCLLEQTNVLVRYSGSGSGQPVTLSHVHLPLPEGMPAHWGVAAREQMAELSLRHHLSRFGEARIAESLGVQGVTLLPLRLEPGACYLAAVVAVRGRAHGLAISLQSGSRQAESRSPEGGVLASICVGSKDTALLQIDARGRGLVWLAAVWQTARIPLGGAQE